jgi:hypothetical protein
MKHADGQNDSIAAFVRYVNFLYLVQRTLSWTYAIMIIFNFMQIGQFVQET